MKKCELCNSTARMYCESDQAYLCYDCDTRVHGANFLVAKHLRTLLCDSCQSPTPWTASGPKLGPTVSICHSCAVHGTANRSVDHDRHDDDDDEDGDGDEDGNHEEEEEDDVSSGDDGDGSDDGDGDNQVVPMGSKNSPPPPWSSSSSSNSEDSSTKRSLRRNGNSNSRFGVFY